MLQLLWVLTLTLAVVALWRCERMFWLLGVVHVKWPVGVVCILQLGRWVMVWW